MFKTRNRDVMDVLSEQTHRWTSTAAGRWERSIISSRWRSAKRMRPTSRENTPHGWGGAENISTHLRGLSRRARFLISAADSLSVVAGTPLAPGLSPLGAPFQLWRRPPVFYQVQKPAKHTNGEDRGCRKFSVLRKNDCALVQSNLNFRLGQPV